MESSEEELKELYSRLEDDELVSLMNAGTLTATAQIIIEAEFDSRDILEELPDQIVSFELEAKKGRSTNSRIFSGFCGALFGILIGSSVLSSTARGFTSTIEAEIGVRLGIGIVIGLIFLFIFIFVSEKWAKKWMKFGAVVFVGYFAAIFFLTYLM